MALTVAPEVGADSYTSVSDADAYHTAYGTASAWAAVSDKEAALRNATTYLDGIYGSRFKGQRSDPTQTLAWPRSKVFLFDSETSLDDETIPKLIKDATAFLALQGKTAALSATVGAIVRRERIGPMETEYAVSVGSSSGLVKFPFVDALLRPLLGGGFGLTARRG